MAETGQSFTAMHRLLHSMAKSNLMNTNIKIF
jgi:hypothetical protein